MAGTETYLERRCSAFGSEKIAYGKKENDMVSFGSGAEDLLGDDSSNIPYRDPCSMGEKDCSEHNPKNALSIEDIKIPKYPPGKMGFWFRPVIAGYIQDGIISGKCAFEILHVAFEMCERPELMERFEKICVGTIAGADLHMRLAMMKEFYVRTVTQTARMAHELAKVGEKLPEDLVRNVERLKEDIRLTLELIREEESGCEKSI